MNNLIGVTSKLDIGQRAALEQLVFFNANQYRVRDGIEQSIATYGVPEIVEEDGGLRVRLRDVRDAQTLFAVTATGRPLGVAVFARLAPERFVVLHVVVEPVQSDDGGHRAPVLMRLMHEIRRAARQTRGVEKVELSYKRPHPSRPRGVNLKISALA